MVSIGSVVALKPAEVSKSRLGTLPVPLRRRLARCMALDTLAALAAATDQLVVVSDDQTIADRLRRAGIDALVVAEPDPGGMNEALRLGDQLLLDHGYTRVLAAVGDLPAITAEAVGRLLDSSTRLPRAFVADRSGYGTTMLIAPSGELDPRFQGASAQAHRMSGAVPVEDPDPRLTRDVDAVEDLDAVIALGVGPHTAGLIGTDRIGDYAAVTIAEPAPGPSGDYVVITDAGRRLPLPASVLDVEIRFLRPGQRLHAVAAGGRLLSAWL